MSNSAELFARAWQHHQANEYAQAEGLYREILQNDPRHADAWCFLGAVCQARGNATEAEQCYRRALDLVPRFGSAWNCLGIVLAQLGRLDEAADCFQQLLQFDPTDADACNNLGLVRGRQGRWNEALASHQRALQLRPDFPAAQVNLEKARQELVRPAPVVLATVGPSGNAPEINPPLLSIITPTYQQKNLDLFRRMLLTVQTQTYVHWEHLVCSDGPAEPTIQAILAGHGDHRRRYLTTSEHRGGYGAFVRQEVMQYAQGKYMVFLDDDNILMPDYLEKMVHALETARNGERFAICKILHFGPLRRDFGPPPMYLRGEPKVQFIDTLQIMVEAAAMREVGWIHPHHYYADGFTYEELGRRFRYVRLEECLAIHM